jgi:hypothetical protein
VKVYADRVPLIGGVNGTKTGARCSRSAVMHPRIETAERVLQWLRAVFLARSPVATLAAEGLLNKGIALKLGITEHTVSNNLFRIYNELGTLEPG